MKHLSVLEERIQTKFRNPLLLKQAVTHCSFLNENRGLKNQSNERLEFLGDAVLSIVVTEHIFQLYPDKNEGSLTEIRGHLINGAHATTVAEKLGINDFLLLSRGEHRDFKSRPSILADTLEAIIGALYLDQGMEAARTFITNFILVDLPENIDAVVLRDAKSLLQEVAQAKVGHTPRYEVLTENGPDHDRKFTVGVYIGSSLLTKGSGTSKARAEMQAAEIALEKIKS